MQTENTNYDLTGTFGVRRFRVMRYWGNGKHSKVQIGDIFGKSEGWAIKEIGIIYKRLDVHSPQEMVMVALKRDIFTKLNCDLMMEV